MFGIIVILLAVLKSVINRAGDLDMSSLADDGLDLAHVAEICSEFRKYSNHKNRFMSLPWP